jgi:hypothetical protein
VANSSNASPRSRRTRVPSAGLFPVSPSIPRPALSIVAQSSAKRIVDKMQLLALKRPNMLHLVEILIDGMLTDRRRADRHAKRDA